MRTVHRDDDPIQVRRHILAIRAFHTGLIAETHRHLRALQQMAPYIELMRRPYPTTSAKLAAVRAACRELRRLEALKEPWRETYRDFRRSLGRARALFARLVRRSSS